LLLSPPILCLLPQRPPFVMIDAFVDEGNELMYSQLTVREDNILLEDGALSASGMVENIAQTAAARIGYICGLEGRPAPIGYIGAIQHLRVTSLPIVGEVLRTSVTIQNQIFNATQIRGEVRRGDDVLASCEMKIFISNQTK
jgi:predicted hotdog family 3-hydroxylacyl-ACP dehydratase